MARIHCVLLLMSGAGCGGRGALVTILNKSPHALQTVVVSGRGFADTLTELAPGGMAALRVRPRGESGIGVTFTAAGRHVSVPEQGYFEGAGGYVAVITVDSTLRVSTQVALERY